MLARQHPNNPSPSRRAQRRDNSPHIHKHISGNRQRALRRLYNLSEESRHGVTLTKAVLFGGTPRTAIGAHYIVQSPRNPQGRKFETLGAAKRHFNVQVSLRPRDGQSTAVENGLSRD